MASGTRAARARGAAPAPAPAAAPAPGHLVPLGPATPAALAPRPPAGNAWYQSGARQLVSVDGQALQSFGPLGTGKADELGARARAVFGNMLPADVNKFSFESFRADASRHMERYNLKKNKDDARVVENVIVQTPGFENLQAMQSPDGRFVIADKRKQDVMTELKETHGCVEIPPWFVNAPNQFPSSGQTEPDDVEYRRPPVIGAEAATPPTPPTPTQSASYPKNVPALDGSSDLNAAERVVSMFEKEVVEGPHHYPPLYQWNMVDFFKTFTNPRERDSKKQLMAARYDQYLCVVVQHPKNDWGENFGNCRMGADELRLFKRKNADVKAVLMALPGKTFQERAFAYAKKRCESATVPMEA